MDVVDVDKVQVDVVDVDKVQVDVVDVGVHISASTFQI